MNVCTNCGQENALDANVCQACGQVLEAAAMPPPQLLAQIQGLIPPEPIISSGRRRADIPAFVTDKEQDVDALIVAAAGIAQMAEEGQDAGDAISEPETESEAEEVMASEPSVPPPLPPEDGISSGQWLTPFSAPQEQQGRVLWVLAILLVGISGLGLLLPLFDATAPRRPAVELAYSYIQVLPANSRVLLAWDYEPTTQGEMQLLAFPILRHLSARQARMANVSLRPTGPAVAADAIRLTERYGLAGPAAPPVVDLGYIPGDATALRALAFSPVVASGGDRDESSLQVMELSQTDGIDAFDLIIEFSGETATTQEWIEQVAVRSQTPVLIAASGAVAPVLRAYEQSGQIAALLSGYTDALAYEALLGEGGPATRQTTAQSLVHLFFIGVTLLALVRRS